MVPGKPQVLSKLDPALPSWPISVSRVNTSWMAGKTDFTLVQAIEEKSPKSKMTLSLKGFMLTTIKAVMKLENRLVTEVVDVYTISKTAAQFLGMNYLGLHKLVVDMKCGQRTVP